MFTTTAARPESPPAPRELLGLAEVRRRVGHYLGPCEEALAPSGVWRAPGGLTERMVSVAPTQLAVVGDDVGVREVLLTKTGGGMAIPSPR